MRPVLGGVSFLLIAAILKLWGRRWISTTTSRILTTLVMRVTIRLANTLPADRQTGDAP